MTGGGAAAAAADGDGDDELNRWARRAWAALDLLHVVHTFVPETQETARALGLDPRFAHFAMRAAPLGPVPPQVVAATFFVYDPALVARGLRDVWNVTTPEAVVAARVDVAAASLQRLAGEHLADDVLAEVLPLLAQAVGAASVAGRPLFAAWSSVPEPEAPLARLWLRATQVREHRGDGHMAALLHAPLDAVEALLLAVIGGTGLAFARATRGWRHPDYLAALARLRDRGLATVVALGDGALTGAGRSLRADVE
ncbi:SCO6745 family protein, partial [Angustibacter aerolatus]